MSILVQKFGGTSLSSKEKRLKASEKILNAIKKGFSPVVVVSAMGRKGEPYATDTLINLIDESFKIQNPMASDLLISCGETISAVIMCNELYNLQIDSVPLTGGQAGIITNNNFNNSEYVAMDTSVLNSIISHGKVPVITGFQGKTEDGFVTTLGRGGSDVSAAIIGAELGAEEIEIYTDVDGIMTADPRIVPEATLIKELSYNETFQFADEGAKVIHPKAVDIAAKANIPLIIKNTMNDCMGTIIKKEVFNKSSQIITGITYMSGRIQIKISLQDNWDNRNFNSLLNVLADNKINIDLINIFLSHLIFTIDSMDFDKLNELLNLNNIKYTYIDNCSKISIIGNRMRGIPGIMAKIINTLAKENIEILQTADSHTTIWCLIKNENTLKAINLLHKSFNLS